MVSVGIHDHLSGAFAAGGLDAGLLFDSIGTSESVIATCQEPLFDTRVAAHGLAQGAVWIEEPIYYLAGGLQTAGAAVEWFRRELGGKASISELVQEAAKVDEGIPIVFAPSDPKPDAASPIPKRREPLSESSPPPLEALCSGRCSKDLPSKYARSPTQS